MLTLHWFATLACIALATISRSSASLSPSSRTYWADSDKQQLTPERTLSNVRSLIRCCHRCQTYTQCVAVSYCFDTQLCHMATKPPVAGTGTPGCMTYQVSAPELGLLLGDLYYNPVVDTCYLRVTQHLIEWDEAEEQCKDYGMKLVAFETEPEIDFIIGLYNSGDHDWYSLNVGLRLTNGLWKWEVDPPTPLIYDRWMAPNNNDGSCANFYEWPPENGTFGLNDHPCEDKIGYICEDMNLNCYPPV